MRRVYFPAIVAFSVFLFASLIARNERVENSSEPGIPIAEVPTDDSPGAEKGSDPQRNEAAGHTLEESKSPVEADATVTIAMSAEERAALVLRESFSNIASESPGFARNRLEELFSARKGDEVLLPTMPPLSGTITHNHVHETGARAFGVALADHADAQFSIVVGADGSIDGHLVQSGNLDAFAVNAENGQILLTSAKVSDIVCSWKSGKSALLGQVAVEDENAPAAGEVPQGVIPILNSRPSSAFVIYLDFDGEVVENTSWLGGQRIDAQPWGDDASIPGIFEVMAEDFRPYDVNVTTDRAVFDAAATNRRCMAIFTPTKDAAPSAGGVAYLNSFGSPVNYMCWVYNRGARNAGETGSHEVGHQLGLRHDGESVAAEEYYFGHTHAPTNVRWGAIMGASFGQRISHWSKGEYNDANRFEDDLAEIDDYLNYLPDDHADTNAGATVIPTNVSLSFSTGGFIGRTGEADRFRLNLNKAGTVTVNASPVNPTYTNLDIVLELLDAAGNVIQNSAPAGPFTGTITATNLPIGNYYIRVYGGGLGDTTWAENGYGDYCSLGPYTLNGTYPFLLIPEIPTGLTATDGTSTDNVFVNWNSAQDADAYLLFRSQIDDPATATQIADTTATSYTDTTALHNVIYHYWVRAYNVQGSSDFSVGDTGYRRLPPPSTPTSFNATDGVSTQWTRLTWAIANFAYEYEVYRNTVNSTSGGTLIATVPGSSTSYDDTTGTHGVVYYYYLRSRNPEAVSSFSSVNSGYRSVPPPATPGGVSATDGASPTSVTITWSSSALAAGYYVYRNSTNSSNGATSIGATNGALSFSDTGGIAGSVYYYFVRAYNEFGFSGFSSGDAGHRLAIPPVSPGGVDASKGDFPGNVRITWDATADTVDYQVFRNTENSTTGLELLASQPGRFFYDNTARAGRTYYYFIRSRNSVGVSPYSNGVVGFIGAEDDSDDAYENNDTLSRAWSLKADEGDWLSEDEGPGIVNDRDWYEVKTGFDVDRLDIIVSYDGNAPGFTVQLYDASGNPVAATSDGAGAKVISFDGALPSQSYFLSVEDIVSEGVSYDVLWMSLSADESGAMMDSSIGSNPVVKAGEGIVNSSGGGQTVSSLSRSRATRTGYFSSANRSAVADILQLRGTGGNRNFAVAYFESTGGSRDNVTAGAITGAETTDLIPLAEAEYSVHVRPLSRVRYRTGSIYLAMVSTSGNDPSVSDTNRFHVTKIKERKPRRGRRSRR